MFNVCVFQFRGSRKQNSMVYSGCLIPKVADFINEVLHSDCQAHILAPLLCSCVTSDKLLNISVLQFPTPPSKMEIILSHSIVKIKGVNVVYENA